MQILSNNHLIVYFLHSLLGGSLNGFQVTSFKIFVYLTGGLLELPSLFQWCVHNNILCDF